MKKLHPKILFENDALIVLDKPAGLLSVPDRHDLDIPNLKHWLMARYELILPVHRLDRGTSGVICFAKDKESQRFLSQQFELRTVQKTYHAIAKGGTQSQEGEIGMPIAPQFGGRAKMMVAATGKPAHTFFKVLEVLGSYTYFEIKPSTGRTHQIRVHLAHLGCPVLSDELYGGGGPFYLSSIKKKRFNKGKFGDERPLLQRPALHAFSLSIKMREDEQLSTFTAEIPKDMKATLNQLRKIRT